MGLGEINAMSINNLFFKIPDTDAFRIYIFILLNTFYNIETSFIEPPNKVLTIHIKALPWCSGKYRALIGVITNNISHWQK